jgi:hypothetical protein
MSQVRFSGPIVSTNGFTGPITGDVVGTLTGNQIIPTATVAATGSTEADAAAVLKIYPATGDGINALTVTTGSLDIAANTAAMLIAYNATTWYSLPLLPS